MWALWIVFYEQIRGLWLSHSLNLNVCDFYIWRNLKQLFEVFTVVKIQLEVFQVVMSYSDVGGYQHFRGPFRWKQHGPLKYWYPTTTQHGITKQKTSTWILHDT